MAPVGSLVQKVHLVGFDLYVSMGMVAHHNFVASWLNVVLILFEIVGRSDIELWGGSWALPRADGWWLPCVAL